jgi:hypothetical protein
VLLFSLTFGISFPWSKKSSFSIESFFTGIFNLQFVAFDTKNNVRIFFLIYDILRMHLI